MSSASLGLPPLARFAVLVSSVVCITRAVRTRSRKRKLSITDPCCAPRTFPPPSASSCDAGPRYLHRGPVLGWLWMLQLSSSVDREREKRCRHHLRIAVGQAKGTRRQEGFSTEWNWSKQIEDVLTTSLASIHQRFTSAFHACLLRRRQRIQHYWTISRFEIMLVANGLYFKSPA